MIEVLIILIIGVAIGITIAFKVTQRRERYCREAMLNLNKYQSIIEKQKEEVDNVNVGNAKQLSKMNYIIGRNETILLTVKTESTKAWRAYKVLERLIQDLERGEDIQQLKQKTEANRDSLEKWFKREFKKSIEDHISEINKIHEVKGFGKYGDN